MWVLQLVPSGEPSTVLTWESVAMMLVSSVRRTIIRVFVLALKEPDNKKNPTNNARVAQVEFMTIRS
jgi:CRISPR/Cas system endoribonuclease Cas6 (RAMP superfamily)